MRVNAEDLKYGGHLKLTETGSRIGTYDPREKLAGRRVYTHDLDARLKAENAGVRWGWQLHAEALGQFSDDLEAFRDRSHSSLEDRTQFFDLSSTVDDHPENRLDLRFDRAFFSFRTAVLVVQVGRQALSWGNGLAFQVLDLFSPFSPVEFDKDYKSGSDMLYLQYVLGRGASVEVLVVPRRDESSGDLESGESSFAAKLRAELAGFGFDFVAAEHYDSEVAGIGVSHDLAGGVLRSDLAFHHEAEKDRFNALLNYDRSFVGCGHNIYLFGEYFRNGYGSEPNSDLVAPLNQALTDRLLRGELFTVRQNYLALGIQAELAARLNQYLTHIQSLDDGSAYVQVRTVVDLMQDLYLTAGFNIPAGSSGSEFGGYPVQGTTRLVEPSRSGFLKLAYYF